MYYVYFDNNGIIKYVSKEILTNVELNYIFVELPDDFFIRNYKIVNNNLIKQDYFIIEPINYNPENKFNTVINFTVKKILGSNDNIDNNYNENVNIKTTAGILNVSNGFFVNGIFNFNIIIPDYIQNSLITIYVYNDNYSCSINI